MEAADYNVFDEATKSAPPSRHRVLVAVSDISLATRFERAITSVGHEPTVAADEETFRKALACRTFDVLLIAPRFAEDTGIDLMHHAARVDPYLPGILVTDDAPFDVAVQAIRAGVTDVVSPVATTEDLLDAVSRAVERSRERRGDLERVTRLREMCRKLSEARQESHRQVELLCQDLAEAYDDIAARVDDATTASEFRTLLGQELDLESLLRTTLEYMLTKTGPTNAAVFLPDDSRQYGLGAYVNYDCPRDAAEVLLEHLAESVCPAIEEEDNIVRFEDADEFAASIGPEVSFLQGSQMIALRCHDGNDTLAVLVLFRNAENPFGEELPRVLDTLRTIFAKQLASVIHIFHRARPEWPTEPAEDSFDFEDDYGLGGMAA